MGLVRGILAPVESVQLQSGQSTKGQDWRQLFQSQGHKVIVRKDGTKDSQVIFPHTNHSWTVRILCIVGIGYSWGLRGKLSEGIGLDFPFVSWWVVDLLKIFWSFDHIVPDCQLFTLHDGRVPQIRQTRRNDPHVLLEKQETSLIHRMACQPSILKTSRSPLYQLHLPRRTTQKHHSRYLQEHRP